MVCSGGSRRSTGQWGPDYATDAARSYPRPRTTTDTDTARRDRGSGLAFVGQ